MKTSKSKLKLFSAICCLIVFLIPFAISNRYDSLFSTLSISFTGLGAVATLFTLFIALNLYQKYGSESRFIERQTDKTLELVDYLKGKIVHIKLRNFTLMLRFKIDDYENLNDPEFYNTMKSKTIIIKEKDYEKFFEQIVEIKKSYWLPKEIKQKADLLDYIGYSTEKINPEDEQYARMDFNLVKDGQYVIPVPNMTVKEYVNNKNELIKAIENWLANHCDIKIDLKFEEPNQKIINKTSLLIE